MCCNLREWQIEDAESLAELLNNKNILNNLRDGLPYPYTVKDAREFIQSILNADKNSTFCFAIVKDDKVVGSIGVFRQSNIHSKTCELGYYVGEQYWNKGIATCAVKRICEFIFDNTDIIRIYAEPFARNKASCRVLEKAGFVYEGTLKCNAVKNSVIEDMNMYAIVKMQ